MGKRSHKNHIQESSLSSGGTVVELVTLSALFQQKVTMGRRYISMWAILMTVVIIGAVGALCAHSLTEHFVMPSRPLRLSMIGDNHYRFIDPLISSNADGTEVPPRYESLNKRLKSAIGDAVEAKKITAASVYVRDFTTGIGLEVYSGERYNPASLLKLPVMMAFYKIAEGRPSILRETITITSVEASKIQSAYPPQKHVLAGHTYTVEEAIEYMIRYSDNDAATALISYLNASGRDYEWLNEVFNDLGVHELRIGSDFIDPKTYSLFLRVLYNATYLNRDMSEKALTLLSQTSFGDGIRAGIASSTLVAHKFGEFTAQSETGTVLENQLHDCGIVYSPKNPFALCVMTKGMKFSDLAATIAHLSSIVYEDQVSR